jgi:hypothetical protein
MRLKVRIDTSKLRKKISTENIPRTPRIALKGSDNARRLIRRVLAEIFAQIGKVESAAKVANF